MMYLATTTVSTARDIGILRFTAAAKVRGVEAGGKLKVQTSCRNSRSVGVQAVAFPRVATYNPIESDTGARFADESANSRR